MNEIIKKYLIENKDLVYETIDYSAKESIVIGESESFNEKISVLLTDDYELESITHHEGYEYPDNIIYIVASMDCETYVVENNYIENFLTAEQLEKFNTFYLNNEEIKLYLSKQYEANDLEELSDIELISEALQYINDEQILLPLFSAFDSKLYEKFIESINEEIDWTDKAELAKERMFDNLLFDEINH